MNIGTASKNREEGGQDWRLAHAREVARECRRSTISVGAGDAVALRPDARGLSDRGGDSTSTVGGSNGQMWTWMVHQLLGSRRRLHLRFPRSHTYSAQKGAVGANLTRKPRQARSVADVVALHQAQLMVLLCGGRRTHLLGRLLRHRPGFAPEVDVLRRSAHHGRRHPHRLGPRQFGAKSAAKTAALEQSGVWRWPDHRHGRNGTRINDQPVVKLQLHIEGPGIAQFDTQDRVIERDRLGTSPAASWWCSSTRPPRSSKSIGSVAL